MQRVAIVGCGGSGKSTLARRIGARTGLPVVHLDRHFWSPGWVETPRADWARTVGRLAEEDRWVIDGNYGGTMERRFERADTIVFLDFPRWLCLLRIVRRRIRFRGRTRPDLTPGCPERIDRQFLAYVWGYRATRRAGVLERLARASRGRRVEVLRNPRDVDAFLARLPSGTVPAAVPRSGESA